MSSDRDMARGRWRSLLPMLGVDRRYLTGKHSPCPACGGVDRFRFDDKDGAGTFFCTHCGAGDGFTLLTLLRGWSFKEASARVRELCGVAPLERRSSPVADGWLKRQLNDLWTSGLLIKRDDGVTRYLDARGIRLEVYPRSLRYVQRCAYAAKPDPVTLHPAMVAKIMSADGVPTGLHRTYLADDGVSRLDVATAKKMWGFLPPGGAVRLCEGAGVMGIAEGIETALAARALTGVAVWAALSADRLMTWDPPPGTTEVVVFADNDLSFTGQASGYGLARKLHARGIEVKVSMPDKPGTDWADMLKAAA